MQSFTNDELRLDQPDSGPDRHRKGLLLKPKLSRHRFAIRLLASIRKTTDSPSVVTLKGPATPLRVPFSFTDPKRPAGSSPKNCHPDNLPGTDLRANRAFSSKKWQCIPAPHTLSHPGTEFRDRNAWHRPARFSVNGSAQAASTPNDSAGTSIEVSVQWTTRTRLQHRRNQAK